MRTLLVNLNAEMMDHLEGFPYVELTRRPGAGNVVRLRGVKEESERTSKLYPKGNNRKNASFVISGKYAHSIGMQHGVRYRLEPATSGTKDRGSDATLYFVARMLGEIPKAGERGRKERLEFPVMTVTERIKKNKAQREAAAAERAKTAAAKTAKPAEAPKAPEKRVWSPADVKDTAPVAAAPAAAPTPAATAAKPLVMYLTRDALSLFTGFDRIQVFRRISGNNRGTVALRGTKLEQPNNNNSGVYPIQKQGSTRILVIPADDVVKLGLPTTGVRYALPLSAQKADETGGPIFNLKALTEQPPAGTPMATLAHRGQKVDALPQPERAEDKVEPKAAPAEVPAETAPVAPVEAATEAVADTAPVEAPVSAEPAAETAPETPAPAVEPPVLAAPVAIPPLPADASPTDLLGVIQVMFGNMQATVQALATAHQQSNQSLATVLDGVRDSNLRLAKVLEALGTDSATHERRIETLEKQLAERAEPAAPAANPRPAAGTKPAVAAKAGETHRH